MITLKNIEKYFNNKCVLTNINFNIPPNSITTLIGPNGIGKTTLLNIICGALYPDNGEITFTSDESIFTVLSGVHHLYAKNTVKENVIFFAILRGLTLSKIKENISKYEPYFPLYTSIKNKLFEELSTGQKQLITIFTALICNADCLLLDEPTEGLDLEHKSQLINILLLLKQFKTIILTSHDPHFVSNLSDQFIFLHNTSVSTYTKHLTQENFLKLYKSFY